MRRWTKRAGLFLAGIMGLGLGVVALAVLGILAHDVMSSRNGDALPADGGVQGERARTALLSFLDSGAHPEARRCEAFVIVKDDLQVFNFGNTATRYNTHSIRKSLLSALIGIAVDKGHFTLESTLETLGIDETRNPLTAKEKSATVRDLLTSRSGVFIRAAGESQTQSAARPNRGQYAPGEFYYYNNWDFNVLGAIFERQTGLSIGQALKQWIADPIGMSDFRATDVTYSTVSTSDHRQYIIWMSARDLARFGVLYLNDGAWDGRQVVPADYVRESVKPHAMMPEPIINASVEGFGYSWWIDVDGKRIWSLGWGGQSLLISPEDRALLVARNNTGLNPLHYVFLLLTEHPDRDDEGFCYPHTLRQMLQITRRSYTEQ